MSENEKLTPEEPAEPAANSRLSFDAANLTRAGRKLARLPEKYPDMPPKIAEAMRKAAEDIALAVKNDEDDDYLFEILHYMENNINEKELRAAKLKQALKTAERVYATILAEARAMRPREKLTPELLEMLKNYYEMRMTQAFLKKPVADQKAFLAKGWKNLMDQGFETIEQGKQAIDLGVSVYVGTYKGPMSGLENAYRNIMK